MALILAMLIVTLVATLAASAVAMLGRQREAEWAERSHLQASWILAGALDWARLVLREDALNGNVDHLGEAWAVPLRESRLSTFLSREAPTAQRADATDELFLSGQITDLQSRINVLNLVQDGQVSLPTVAALEKLYRLLGLPGGEVAQLATELRLALASRSSAPQTTGARQTALLPPVRLEQLTAFGVSATSLRSLRPYVTLLPERTPVNVNTASPEVLSALVPALDLEGAQWLARKRVGAPMRSLADAARLAAERGAKADTSLLAVGSRYFEVEGYLRGEAINSEWAALVRRDTPEVQVLWAHTQPMR